MHQRLRAKKQSKEVVKWTKQMAFMTYGPGAQQRTTQRGFQNSMRRASDSGESESDSVQRGRHETDNSVYRLWGGHKERRAREGETRGKGRREETAQLRDGRGRAHDLQIGEDRSCHDEDHDDRRRNRTLQPPRGAAWEPVSRQSQCRDVEGRSNRTLRPSRAVARNSVHRHCWRLIDRL